ncbi:unnamed protein product [Blepharisma stoltei]|uniref:Palmitoyltransferase n=1 Tax=Blepharisma stoltei TaxID=1481888 RepID=A0AAU9JKY5_9CILI|nr:unnamed protein product [Blepharisma stoltei]
MENSRKSGLDCPPHPYQIFTWLYNFASIFVFYFFIVPSQPYLIQILMSSLFGLSQLLLLFYAFLLTKSNPTDPILYKKKKINLDETYITFCSLCYSEVSPDSKHCMKCNRCVHKFDHHCKFVNNCIGKSNYNLFLKTAILMEMVETIFLVCCTYTIYNWSADLNGLKEKINQDYGENADVVLIAICSAFEFLTIAILFANGYLLLFHIWLIKHKMTTYDFISKNKPKSSSMDLTSITDSFGAKVTPTVLIGLPQFTVNK